MKTFLVIGKIIAPEKMNDALMQTHIAYTTEWMKEKYIVLSSLTADQSASVTLVLADTLDTVEHFYHEEPFFKEGILSYDIQELQIHHLDTETLKKSLK